MADNDEHEDSGTGTEVAEEVAETAAPGSVADSVEPIITAIKSMQDAILGKLDEIAPKIDTTPVDDGGENDSTPTRKPWTHRGPFQ